MFESLRKHIMAQNKFDKQVAPAAEIRDSQIQLVKQEFSRAKAYASEYRDNTPIAHFFNTRLKRVSELLSEFQSGRVLDIGCGPAIIANTFRGRPIEYYGVDISEDMIKECIGAFGHDPQFRFFLGKIEELPFPDSYFDVSLCLGVIEYVPEMHVAMKEMTRVLKTNGIVIVTMHNRSSPYRVCLRYGFGKLKNGMSKLRRLIIGRRNDQGTKTPQRPFFKIYSEKALRHLLTSEGLRVEDVVYYDFNVFLAPLDALFQRASVYFSRKLEFLCRSKLKFLGTGFILKCRKN
jgi:ubiquinone/menaquinone biosynthesis C-methylase UbiE